MRSLKEGGLTLGMLMMLLLGNWLLGRSPSERALRDFDQHMIDAYSSRFSPPPMPRVDGFEVTRRIALPFISYYQGQSLVGGSVLSCVDRSSVVLWYGVGATILWQDGLWFPDRASVHTRFAATGDVR